MSVSGIPIQERIWLCSKDYTFSECLELTWEHKAQYTTEDIVERAGRAIQEGILNGTTVFRAFADVDSIGKRLPSTSSPITPPVPCACRIMDWNQTAERT